MSEIASMRELGVLDSVIDALPIESIVIIKTDQDTHVMAMEEFVETGIVLTWTAGAAIIFAISRTAQAMVECLSHRLDRSEANDM